MRSKTWLTLLGLVVSLGVLIGQFRWFGVASAPTNADPIADPAEVAFREAHTTALAELSNFRFHVWFTDASLYASGPHGKIVFDIRVVPETAREVLDSVFAEEPELPGYDRVEWLSAATRRAQAVFGQRITEAALAELRLYFTGPRTQWGSWSDYELPLPSYRVASYSIEPGTADSSSSADRQPEVQAVGWLSGRQQDWTIRVQLDSESSSEFHQVASYEALAGLGWATVHIECDDANEWCQGILAASTHVGLPDPDASVATPEIVAQTELPVPRFGLPRTRRIAQPYWFVMSTGR